MWQYNHDSANIYGSGCVQNCNSGDNGCNGNTDNKVVVLAIGKQFLEMAVKI